MVATRIEDTFINECGNRIRIIVSGGATSVLFSLEGPTSQMENEITPREARALRDLLDKVLAP